MLKVAVTSKTDATIRRGIFVNCKGVASLGELPARRGCAENSDAPMIGVVRLMYVAEDGKPYFPRYLDALEKFVAVVESDGVQPLAAHRYGWMVQADHDVVRARGRDFAIEASEFAGLQVPASVPADATINAYN